LPLKSSPGGWSPGRGKVFHHESGARLKAPQKNAITGFYDRKAIEISVVLIPQAESPESRMPEISTSGSMSGDGKRSVAKMAPRPSSTLSNRTFNLIKM
jgi:hypothetical protein